MPIYNTCYRIRPYISLGAYKIIYPYVVTRLAYIVTSLQDYIVRPIILYRYKIISLPDYIVTSLKDLIVTLLQDYIVQDIITLA